MKTATKNFNKKIRTRGSLFFLESCFLIDTYKGTGVIKRVKDGTIREFIQTDHDIGMYWGSDKSEYISTNVACIIYSKKDAHITLTREAE